MYTNEYVMELGTISALKKLAKELKNKGYATIKGYNLWKTQDKEEAVYSLINVINTGILRENPVNHSPVNHSIETPPTQELLIDEDNLDYVLTEVYNLLQVNYSSDAARNIRIQPFFSIVELQVDQVDQVDQEQVYQDEMIMQEDTSPVDQLFFEADQSIEDFMDDNSFISNDSVFENPVASALLNIEQPQFLTRQTQFIRPEEMNRLLKDLEETPSKIDILKNYPNINRRIEKCIGIQLE